MYHTPALFDVMVCNIFSENSQRCW